MQLWKKSYDVDAEISKFTVGNDYVLDQKLVYFDCVASIAHAKMLEKAGILKNAELKSLVEGLKEIIRLSKINKFEIKPEDEDCHTAIENYLVSRFGDLGKKIHTGRSRNDQVLTAIRLYEKSELNEILILLDSLKESVSTITKRFGNVPLPGYTHMQKAMPSSVKMWFCAYAQAIDDDKEIIFSIKKIIDKSPLGSAAGFGVPVLNNDRKLTASLLGFSSIMETMYCQNSRGKYEALITDALLQIMMDINKISTDLILFSMQEFGFFELPKEFCTGSSIMPQKKNPDVLELLRANYSIVLGYDIQIKSIYSNLISGYNRDMQLTKEPIMRSIDTTKDCIRILSLVLQKLGVNEKNCRQAMTRELYATEEAYKLVKKGMPFRDAYREIGKRFS